MRFEEYKESFKGGQGREDEEIMELGEKMALLLGVALAFGTIVGFVALVAFLISKAVA